MAAGRRVLSTERLMIHFGDLGRDPGTLRQWEMFLANLLASDAWKATHYDSWTMEGVNWGWMSRSREHGDLVLVFCILRAFGFDAWLSGCDRLTLKFAAPVESGPPSGLVVQEVMTAVDLSQWSEQSRSREHGD